MPATSASLASAMSSLAMAGNWCSSACPLSVPASTLLTAISWLWVSRSATALALTWLAATEVTIAVVSPRPTEPPAIWHM